MWKLYTKFIRLRVVIKPIIRNVRLNYYESIPRIFGLPMKWNMNTLPGTLVVRLYVNFISWTSILTYPPGTKPTWLNKQSVEYSALLNSKHSFRVNFLYNLHVAVEQNL